MLSNSHSPLSRRTGGLLTLRKALSAVDDDVRPAHRSHPHVPQEGPHLGMAEGLVVKGRAWCQEVTECIREASLDVLDEWGEMDTK